MRQQVTQVRCDLCGYGGGYTRPEDFQTFAGGVDLCRWCAQVRGPGILECGQHVVTIAAAGWSCSCGGTYHDERARLAARLSPLVLDVVPSLVCATANVHVNR